MTTVSQLREMLAYCPGDWEITAFDEDYNKNIIRLHQHDPGDTVTWEEVCIVDLDNEELNPIRPLKVYVNNDGSTTPLGLMSEEEQEENKILCQSGMY